YFLLYYTENTQTYTLSLHDALPISVQRIKRYYYDKGYGNTTVKVYQRKDSLKTNAILLTFDIDKGNKTKINQINISGNKVAKDRDRKSTRLNSSHVKISYAVFCLKK